MKVLKVIPYMGHMVYIRQIGKDYFEYLLEYCGEIYSSYIIILPEEGKKKLTKSQVNGCVEMVYAGAEATINALIGIDVSEEEKEKVEMFEKAVKETEKVKNGKK